MTRQATGRPSARGPGQVLRVDPDARLPDVSLARVGMDGGRDRDLLAGPEQLHLPVVLLHVAAEPGVMDHARGLGLTRRSARRSSRSASRRSPARARAGSTRPQAPSPESITAASSRRVPPPGCRHVRRSSASSSAHVDSSPGEPRSPHAREPATPPARGPRKVVSSLSCCTSTPAVTISVSGGMASRPKSSARLASSPGSASSAASRQPSARIVLTDVCNWSGCALAVRNSAASLTP